MTSQRADFARFVSQKLPQFKQLNENLKLLVGGWHATGAPHEVLELGADHVITGEAEEIFPQLLLDLYNNPQILPKVLLHPVQQILINIRHFLKNFVFFVQLKLVAVVHLDASFVKLVTNFQTCAMLLSRVS